jgi:multimeric flavodoxin WrbA
MKKIIGLSCGSKNGACETMIRAAAAGAAEFGVETEIIRAMELKVTPCRGCHACGKTNKCVLKDDVDWILEKTLLEDAALIVGVPCYHIRANAYMEAIGERMNPFFMRDVNILKKTKVGAIIGCGGSGYDGWASLTLLLTNIFVQHTRVLVDQIQVNQCALKEWNLWLQPKGGPLTSHTHQARIQDLPWEKIWELWDEKFDPVDFAKKSFERAKELGRNVARAMDMPIEKVKYAGEETGVACPLCHCNVLLVPENLPHVYCPVCAVRGVVTQDNGQMKVRWNEEDVKHPRFTPEAVKHHFYWLGNNGQRRQAKAEEIEALRQEYISCGTVIKPEKPKS